MIPLARIVIVNYYYPSMNSFINNSKLTAPGRLDVVQKVLQDDPFFRIRMGGPAQWGRKNRCGVRKRYNELTIAVVLELAKAGLDAVNMRRTAHCRRV